MEKTWKGQKQIRWLTKEKCPHHVISRILHPSMLLLHLPSMILCLFLAEASLIPSPFTVFLLPVSLLRWHIPRRTDSIIRIHQHQRHPPMMPWLCRIFQPERLSSTFHGVGKSNQPSLWESHFADLLYRQRKVVMVSTHLMGSKPKTSDMASTSSDLYLR